MDAATDALLTDLCAAAPLAERLGSPPHHMSDHEAEEAATRRLGRWRSQDPFRDGRHWQARLRADGLDEEALARLLGEPTGHLRSRIGSPSWAGWLCERAAPPSALCAPERPPSDVTTQNEPFFANAASALLRPASRRLHAALVRLARQAATPRLDAEALGGQLAEGLRWQVHAMLGRTMALELQLARVSGDLKGEDGQQRFADFLAAFDNPSRQRQLFRDYPVLGRQLTIIADQWHANSLRLAGRIINDAADLGLHFAGGTDIGAVRTVSMDAGDRHRGGQQVAIVGFDSGLVLVYKPRSLRIDVHFAALIDRLNQAGLSSPLRAADCLDRGDYGWSEFLLTRPCRDQDEIRRFYHRQGALLALLGLLHANDMHAENLIAVGEHPVLIDLETLLQPQLPIADERLSAAEHLAQDAASRSVLQVGLLPALTSMTRDGKAIDVSGLGNRPGQQSSVTVPYLANIGTDAMRIGMERIALSMPDHRPVPKDADLNLLDYADDVTAGYAEMHQLCQRQRAELLADDGPLAAFRGDQVRVLTQSTIVYSTVLRTGFHPDVLRDGLERDRHFDYLWRRAAQTPALSVAIAAERRDLWRNDIPYFSARTDGQVMYDSDGAVIPGMTLTAGLDLARRDLAQWDNEHARAQLLLIRGSLAAAAINASSEYSFPEYALPETLEQAQPDALVEAARLIGDQLAREAFVADQSAQWLGLSSYLGRNWQLSVLTADLFNGLAGVALFLAQLARLCGDTRHAVLARQAAVTFRGQVDRGDIIPASGMGGLPGIVYALCRLADLLEDDSLRDDAAAIAKRLRDRVGDDPEFDIVAGAAGTIGAMRILHAERPGGPAADVIAAAAGHLLASARTYPGGLGWLPNHMAEHGLSTVPLAGFSHGAAGIAWALGEAARVLGDERYLETGREAIDYERGLFDPGLNVWKDVRDPDGSSVVTAWCHGATGIGLARLGCRDTVLRGDAQVDREIDIALRASEQGGYGKSHSLCHGDTGTAELLLTGARVLNRPDLRAQARLRGAAILSTIEANGWICGVPCGTATPSLMVGLAGIGYGLLRIAAHDQVPSVLTLEPAADPGPSGDRRPCAV